MHVNRNVIFCLLVLCYAAWGGGMIAMKYAFLSFTAVHAVFARVAVAGCIYLLLAPRWLPLPYRKGDWKYLLLLCLFEPVLFFLFETFSMQYTTASQGGVIAACFPVVTALAAWLVLGERLSRRVVAAVAITVIGVAGTAAFADETAQAPNPLLGNALMAGAVFSSAGYAVCVRFIARRYSFLAISAIQAIGGSICFLPMALSVDWPSTFALPALGGMLYLGVVVGFLVYLSFNFSLQHLEAGVVALLGNLIPVFTLLFAWTLLGERLNSLQLGCVCLTLAGVVLATLPIGRRSEPAVQH